MSMFVLEQGCDACIRKMVPPAFYVTQEESKEETDDLFILWVNEIIP